jgi:hypothetical protein
MTPLRHLLVVYSSHEHVVVLRVYLDETGHAKDPNTSVVGVAGCIASIAAWERFEEEWAGVLKEFCVTMLHMNDFAHFHGEFTGWTEEKRQQFLGYLLTIIDKRVEAWVGAILPIAEFNELSDEQKTRLRDPYFILLQDCLHATINFVDSVNSAESVEVVVAMHQEHGWDAYRCVVACAQQLTGGEKLESVTAARPKAVLPLQAADLVAYELCKMGKLMMQPERKPLRYPIERLKPKCWHVEFYLNNSLAKRVS